ncbi:MAG TPA: hypothetical protein VNM45_16555 [Bacillus sp. (in: firmicutes)]|nr:hypothetical protein [Bacillus sp. (in: firmicutes)]
MTFENLETVVFHAKDELGHTLVSGKITGASEVSYFDDLKLKAVTALLNSVDQEHFKNDGKIDLFKSYMEEIIEIVSAIKANERFQGEIKQ